MKSCLIAAFAAVLSGCASYSWTSSVPKEIRTVSVPTFENKSNVTELGAVTTRQVLREFQREGTFAIARSGESALEVQGVIESSLSKEQGYRRLIGSRNVADDLEVVAKVSLIDKTRGTVLFDSRKYRAVAAYTAGDDVMTGERNASGRAAEELARQIVDDVLNFDYSKEK